MKILEKLVELETKLAKEGFPRLSPWWRETVIRFYLSGRRQLVLRVGRRGGKSSSLCRIAVLEALHGEHRVQPGDVGTVAIVSVSRGEASDRLRTIAAILKAIGEPFKSNENEGTIELSRRPVRFKVYTASLAGVVGGTVICALCDEVARWKDDKADGANPATEVLGSLRPALATMPNAKIFLSSSPLSTLDAHYDAFERGDDAFQLVAHATSWEANTTLTEEATHALEPDERLWRREYQAIPMASVATAFTLEQIERAMRVVEAGEYAEPIIILDPSSMKGDPYTIGVARYFRTKGENPFIFDDILDEKGNVSAKGVVLRLDANGNPVRNPSANESKAMLSIGDIEEFPPSMEFKAVWRRIAEKARRYGTRKIVGDQRESYANESEAASLGLVFRELTWSPVSKPVAVERFRALLRDDAIRLPNDAVLKRELLGFTERVTSNGNLTYGARRSGHDDRVAICLTACLADIEGMLSLSPLSRPSKRIVFSPGGERIDDPRDRERRIDEYLSMYTRP